MSVPIGLAALVVIGARGGHPYHPPPYRPIQYAPPAYVPPPTVGLPPIGTPYVSPTGAGAGGSYTTTPLGKGWSQTVGPNGERWNTTRQPGGGYVTSGPAGSGRPRRMSAAATPPATCNNTSPRTRRQVAALVRG
jgi:hypothetical protein